MKEMMFVLNEMQIYCCGRWCQMGEVEGRKTEIFPYFPKSRHNKQRLLCCREGAQGLWKAPPKKERPKAGAM